MFIYPKAEWQILETKLKQLPMAKAEARAFVRFFFSGAAELEPDRNGRILLPLSLRDYAKLDKDVIIIGVSNRIEIWSKVEWDNYNNKVAPMVAEIAENLVDLGI